MWVHCFPVEDADDCSVTIRGPDGSVLKFTARLTSKASGQVIKFTFDDPRRDFEFIPERHGKDCRRHPEPIM